MIHKTKLINTLISLGVFIFFSILIFYPQIQGKHFKAGDNIEYIAKSQEIRELKEEVNREILCPDAIFSGMPPYSFNMRLSGNIFSLIAPPFRSKIDQPM